VIATAYLSNQFPSAVEPYVMEEIDALRRRGFRVISCSARKPEPDQRHSVWAEESIYLQQLNLRLLGRAIWIGLRSMRQLKNLFGRVALDGKESLGQRINCLLHTALGFYLAAVLEDRGATHIHVHHGYFSAWIAMVAARALGISYSLTLHGSDLLVHAKFLDVKLAHCAFCLTISEFNRRHVLEHYPQIRSEDILVQRLGVSISNESDAASVALPAGPPMLLAVGRLHTVKDHAFLLRACRELKRRGFSFRCRIAGDGPERNNLERMIRSLELVNEVTLLGHVAREKLIEEYRQANLVVLTSRSEGIPIALMEAMALKRPVLAPDITGIPELVIPGVTGFLYRPNCIDHFIEQTLAILHSDDLDRVTGDARAHVVRNFNRDANLKKLAEVFTQRLAPPEGCGTNANPVLQQVQLPLQRDRSLPLRVDVAAARSRPRGGVVRHG
jgi:glycosyltransferase involved in cell wall biosynthesis